jgi:hypothetical protein
MAIGLAASYGRQTIKADNVQEESLTKGGYFHYGLSIFGRYQLYRKEKLSLLTECSIGFDEARSWGDSGNPISSNMVGINVYPLIGYDLTDRLGMIASCDLISLGLNYQTSKSNTSEGR